MDVSSVDIWTACSIVLLFLVASIVFLTFQDYGISWDEEVQNAYGENILSYYGSGFTERKAVTPNTDSDDGNLPYYGGGFDVPAVLLQRISPFGPYETRHLLGGLVGIAGLVATWRLGHRLAGPRAGFLALGLTATLPAYYGHMFINPKDLPFAAAMAVVLLLVCDILTDWPAPRWRTIAWLGLAAGVAIALRVGAIVAVADLIVPVGIWIVQAGRRAGYGRASLSAMRGGARLLAALPIAYAAMAVLWPWSVQDVLNPLTAYGMFSHYPFQAELLFEGKTVIADDLPRSYLLVLLLATLPEVLLLGLLLAGGVAVRWLRAGAPRSAAPHSLQMLAVATAALLPLLYFAVERPTAYNGLRHFLFVLPPLAVLAAIAFDRSAAMLGSLFRPWLYAAILLGMALPVARMAALHPFEYIDFNDLFGGLRAAERRFDLDYWGVSLGETTKALAAVLVARGETNPPSPWRVLVDAAPLSASYFMPPFLRAVDETETPDFILDICPCDAPPGSIAVAETRRLGVPLSAVYDVRGAVPVADP